jgi:4-amino-4-deoxy-L-arabinose transferase-like glycosyltransferase/uncharacterized protein YbaR (Trm112 family)
MLPSSKLNLTYRDFAIAIAMVLFAFALRAVVVFDRAYRDNIFIPPPGSDMLTYMTQAQGYEAGAWPDSPFRYLPGISYYFIGLRAVVGHSLGVLALATSWTGALTCGLVIGAGWLLTRRKWGGYLAGLLLAIYPVTIFYSTVFLDPVLATFLVALFVFLALWQQEGLALWRTAALGLVIGLLAITRQNLATLALAWLVYLVMLRRDWRTLVLHTIAFGIAVVIPIAPVTLWNIQSGGGHFQLITNVGIDEVYRANNRDGTGTYYNRPPAWDTVVGSYNDAMMTDLRLDPLRFVELQGRKIGIYWSNVEPANNIDYLLSGRDISPLLRAIPLDFRLLSGLGLIGLGLLFYDQRRNGIFFLLVNVLIFIGIMLIWIEGRVRQPAVVPLALTGAYLLARVPEIVRKGNWQPLITPALLTALLFGFSNYALDHLPYKRPFDTLPADARSLDVVFDGKLRLLGWRTLPDWTGWVAASNGWTTVNGVYVVELFWEVDEPTDQNYNFYLAYVDNSVRYAARDSLIGDISFPPTPTSTWQPGQIYGEISGFRFPAQMPTERSGDIQVGVYLRSGEEGDPNRVITNVPVTSLPDHPNHITLQRLSVLNLNETPQLADGLTTSSDVFGSAGNDQIALKGYHIPATGKPGEMATFTFDWEALGDIHSDYNLFIHVMDANNQLAAQHDGAPRDGAFVTSTWKPYYPVRDDIPIQLPDKPGTYQVYIGLYEVQSHDRLPIDAPDYRPLIAQIEVTP